MTETNLTHFDASGNAVMVDVSEKTVTFREATAHGIITMNAEAFAAVESGTVKKGDVLGVARIAGIMATKRTSELIPLCHPLPLTKVSVDFRLLPEVGFIAAVHGKFCASCNRRRLTSQGFLRPCLASETGCDLRTLLRGGAADEELLQAIRETIWSKPREHHFGDNSMPATRGMYRIGG